MTPHARHLREMRQSVAEAALSMPIGAMLALPRRPICADLVAAMPGKKVRR